MGKRGRAGQFVSSECGTTEDLERIEMLRQNLKASAIGCVT